MIYFDMDGVLADFQNRKEEWCRIRGLTPPKNIAFSEMTKQQQQDTKTFWESLELSYWMDMEPIEYKDTYQWLSKLSVSNKLGIISSAPKTKCETAVQGKMIWLEKHFPGVFAEIHIGTFDKSIFAEGNILVDDRPQNLYNWEQAGGYGILYQNLNRARLDLMIKLEDMRRFFDLGEIIPKEDIIC